MNDSRPILLYDGTCGFCSGIVQFILRHEGRQHWLRFATLRGRTGDQLRTRHPMLATVDSVIWFEPGTPTRPERVLIRSDASLAAAAYLGVAWRVVSWPGRFVPRPLRDYLYDIVAKHRHQLTDADACIVPTPTQRARFLD